MRPPVRAPPGARQHVAWPAPTERSSLSLQGTGRQAAKQLLDASLARVTPFDHIATTARTLALLALDICASDAPP